MAEIEAKTFSPLSVNKVALHLHLTCSPRKQRAVAVAGVFAADAGFPNIDNTPAIAKYLFTDNDSDLPCEDVLRGEGW
jgi:hypothetical protein